MLAFKFMEMKIYLNDACHITKMTVMPIYCMNKNIIMKSFKSSRNIQKKECGPDRSISDNQFSSVTLNELTVKAIIIICNFEFHQRSHTMADINPNGAQITKTV